jgi:hypothetical protein
MQILLSIASATALTIIMGLPVIALAARVVG